MNYGKYFQDYSTTAHSVGISLWYLKELYDDRFISNHTDPIYSQDFKITC